MLIDGRVIAAELVAALKPKLAALAKKRFFGAAVVGEDPVSLNFLRQKERAASELGIDFRLYRLPADRAIDDLRREIGRLASGKTCGGFIVQLPLPERLENKHYVLNAIPKWKDADCLSEAALGAFYTGRHPIVPPSVAVVQELLDRHYRGALRDATVALIGAGFLIGRPVGFWLQNRVGGLMVFDSKVKNLSEHLAGADIVISGAGEPRLFSAKHLKKGAVVIDFGYGKTADPSTSSGQAARIAGDFDPENAEEKYISYTRTPGGTGPVLVSKLFENYWRLNA